MHWASRRETTREEDMAYCLLGLFDINLPLLYGEGKKTFYRLQEEIIKHLDDHTIFIWDVFSVKEIPELRLPRVESTLFYAGIVAESPRQFGNVCDVRKVNPTRRPEKIQVSQKGSQMNLYLKKATPHRIPTDILYKVQKEGFGFFLAALDCIIGTVEYIAESEGVSIWNEARSAMLLLRRPDGCYEKVLSHYEKVYLDEKPTTWEYSSCFIEGPLWQTSLFNNTKASDIKSDPKKLFFRWLGPSFGYSVIQKFTDNKFAAFLLERSSVSNGPLIVVICSVWTVWQQFGTLGLLDVKFQNNRPERPSEFLRELIVKGYSWQVGVPIRDGLGPVLERVIHVNGMAFIATLWEDESVNSSEVSYIKHVFALVFSLWATPQKSVDRALLGAITRTLKVDELSDRVAF
jgi:hypothetical protein